MYSYYFLVNIINGDYMKKFILVIIINLFLCGCMIANTPTSKVEEYLGKYQKLDDSVSLSYVQLSFDEDIDTKYIDKYEDLIEKQYKNLSYEIIEEEIDGNNAIVSVSIKVYDYKEVLDKVDDSNHDKIISSLEKQRDKIEYTIKFNLKRDDKDNWEVLEPSMEDYRKLLGIN